MSKRVNIFIGGSRSLSSSNAWRFSDASPDDSAGVDGDQWLNKTTGEVFKRIDGVYALQITLPSAQVLLSQMQQYITDAVTEANGSAPVAGPAGSDGQSAYQLAMDTGFIGTGAQWIASLKGNEGASPTDEQLIFAVDAYLELHPIPAGAKGDTGATGVGQTGATGSAGASATDAQVASAVATYIAAHPPATGAQGIQGASGTNATNPSFSVATGAAGSSVSVAGSYPNLTLTIPRGDTGSTGATGNTGATGVAGVSGILSGSSTATIGALLLGGTATVSVTVTGATTSMVAVVNIASGSILSLGATCDAYVSSTNTVTVTVRAIIALTLGSKTFNVRVIP